MKYQTYPAYKDSGVEWLGKIPADWQILPLKLVTANKVKDGPHETPKFIDEGVPFFSVDSIQGNQLIFEGSRYISRENHKIFSQKCLPKKGDVLLGKAASVGKVAYVDTDREFNVWSPLAVITPKSEELGKFIFYSLQSPWLQAQCDVLSNSNTQKNLSMQVIDNLTFAFPISNVAKQITNFLDHETAKIDTLIEKQQQLIKLLKEKRQAVISHAVTKGLNPKAPMRDSGVEWLGEVPEHWVVVRLKYYIRLFEQGWSPQCDSRQAEYDEYGVLKVGCVNQGTFRSTENKALPKELNPQLQYLLQEGDLLISRANTKELVGSAAVVDKNYNNLILCDKLYRLRFNELISPQLIAYYLALPIVRQQIELEASGASHSMQNIGQSTIKELPIIVPPLEEITILVSEIKNKIKVFDSILSRANKQIELLKERRTALISAAVTGKIDVRYWNGESA